MYISSNAMKDGMKNNYEHLKAKLEEIFQMNQADLDFGIYRIMNTKREEIVRYLDDQLQPQVKEILSSLASGDTVEIEERMKKIEQQAKRFKADPEDDPEYQDLAERKAGNLEIDALEKEIFSDLFNFFSRYYEDGDFLSLRRYKADVYAIPFEGEEVKLHWANHDQYYIKTSEYFTNYSFSLLESEKRVHFRLIKAETEQNNNKQRKEQRFMLSHEKPLFFDDKDLVIGIEYVADSERRNQERINQSIIETLRTDSRLSDFNELFSIENVNDKEIMVLERHLKQYTARNTFDYFIHKDLGGFLRRELDFFLKNEVLVLEDIIDQIPKDFEKRFAKLKALKQIGHKIILFLAQLEDFQKKLWLKKKFVVETNWCITLDRIPEEFYVEIAANDAQREEWVRLFGIDEIKADSGSLPEICDKASYSEPLSRAFLRDNSYLVLDTALFDECFKQRLIAKIDGLDEQTDGLLIHSENFQALNLLQEKHQEKVKCIYIDPPYNTGQDDFLYKDDYQSSSWLCMLSDRLSLARRFLRQDGTIAVSIDENEVSAILRLMDDIFGKENRVGIASVKRGSVTGHKAINKGLVNITEYLLVYALNKSKWKPKRAYKARERNNRYDKFIINRTESPENWEIFSLLDAFAEYKCIPKNKLKKSLGKAFEDEIYSFVKTHSESVIQLAYPDESNVSKDAQEAIKISRRKENQVFHFKRKGVPDMYLIGGQRLLFYKDRLLEMDGEIVTVEPLSDIWDDILPNDLHNEGGVSLKKGKKPEKLLNRIYDICCDSKNVVFDFFLGTGTTTATALKRGLKFVGVEQSEYFDSKTLLRMKLVNKTRKKHEEERSFTVKYIRLESYEDTLNNLMLSVEKLSSNKLFEDANSREQYLLSYMLDVESKDSLLDLDLFDKPFDYQLAINRHNEIHKTTVDLVETFNYLIGLNLSKQDQTRCFHADFIRDKEDKLVVKDRMRQSDTGKFIYRMLKGTTCKGERTLVIWRQITGNLEEDNVALDGYFRTQEWYTNEGRWHPDVIYVNGDNNLLSIRKDEEKWEVRLIEEAFHRLMFDNEGV